jgi:two-component system, NarL family, response regulator
MDNPIISVMCVDDHRIVREGIGLIVSRQQDMRMVASVASGEDALAAFRTHHPSVTLMDLQLGGMSGVETIRAIRHEAPRSRIVVLTIYQGDEDIHRALQAGATTYLLKDTLSDDLIRVIREVHHGLHPIRPDIAARLAERAAGPTLTPREIQVVELLSRGMRNKDVAASLGISYDTAHVHVKNILAKLNVSDRSAAITVAIRRGIIHLF